MSIIIILLLPNNPPGASPSRQIQSESWYNKERYLLELCRYVVLNPVRANAVKKVEDEKVEQLSWGGRV